MEIEIVLDLGIQISGVLDAAHSTRYSSLGHQAGD